MTVKAKRSWTGAAGFHRLEDRALPILKRGFPFRLATTSYIIPAPIVPNLLFLGPHVDEVELVLFESGFESNLPSRGDIAEMKTLGADLELTFNIHLPADIFLGDPNSGRRHRDRDTALRFYERTLPLDPTVFILHLDSRAGDGSGNSDWAAWQDRVRESVDALVKGGLDPGRVALENLEYPLDLILPLADDHGMSLCLDLGHFIRYRYDLHAELERNLARCSMIHLHGVADGMDHLGLAHLSEAEWEVVALALMSYSKGVTVEVFSLEDLASSLERLESLALQRGEQAS